MKLSIRFPLNQERALKRIAKARYLSIADVVREALQTYLELDATRRSLTKAQVRADEENADKLATIFPPTA